MESEPEPVPEDETNRQYNELNEFLDECINEALRETSGKFQVGVDDRGIDYEQYAKADRFEGFEEDKIDQEGEKMKDYERPPPYKIYRRPLTEEETQNYRQYQSDMSKMKPGKSHSNWDGFDSSVRGVDVTHEYGEPTKPKSDQTFTYKYDKEKGTFRRTNKPESEARVKQDSLKFKRTDEERQNETFRRTVRPESEQRLKQPESLKFKRADDEEEPQFYKSFTRPTINPNMYKPPVTQEERRNKERWTFNQPKEHKPQTMEQDTETENTRRFSDPLSSYQADMKGGGLEHEGQYQTFENFYKTTAKSDLKPDYYKENKRPDPNANVQKEAKVKTAEEIKEATKPGMYEEEVKQELLKLRPPILDRSYWGALPPMGDIPHMKPPADTIVFSLNTGTPTCQSEDECRRTVRELQARHMGKGLADIQYNFLVGGDGNLYEGRGWAYESGINPEKQQGKNYNIAFIGNYQDDINAIPQHMLGPVQQLIVWGNAIRLMTKDTKTAGEYRIAKTEEPK